jgi:hypothetical protein
MGTGGDDEGKKIPLSDLRDPIFVFPSSEAGRRIWFIIEIGATVLTCVLRTYMSYLGAWLADLET